MRKSFYRLHYVNQFYSSVEKKIYRQQEGEYMCSVGFASIQHVPFPFVRISVTCLYWLDIVLSQWVLLLMESISS